MNIIEEILFIVGLILLPYGIYEIAKGEGTRDVKLILIGISIGLFILEFLLVSL